MQQESYKLAFTENNKSEYIRSLPPRHKSEVFPIRPILIRHWQLYITSISCIPFQLVVELYLSQIHSFGHTWAAITFYLINVIQEIHWTHYFNNKFMLFSLSYSNIFNKWWNGMIKVKTLTTKSQCFKEIFDSLSGCWFDIPGWDNTKLNSFKFF